MQQVRLISDKNHHIRAIVEGALENELRLIEAGIQKTRNHLRNFEDAHHLSTEQFLDQYENDRLEGSMEHMEWVGEARMLERLLEKIDILKSIRIEN